MHGVDVMDPEQAEKLETYESKEGIKS